MMYWQSRHAESGWGPLMVLGMVMVALLAAAFVFWFLHTMSPGTPSASPPRPLPPNPEQVLADRLARGDIDVADYESRLTALRGPSGP